MQVAFRIDFGNTIGMGHYVRMKSIAEVFESRGISCEFFTSEDEPVDYSSYKIIIVDTYKVSDEYIESLNSPNRLVMCVDDNALYTYSCDFLLNHFINAEELTYRFGKKKPRLLFGLKYAMLRHEFRDTKPITVRDNANHIFTCFGGSDPFNFTPKVIHALANSNVKITAVLGEKTAFDKEVFALQSENVRVIKTPNNLPQIMGECDIAITAAGSIIVELMSLGVPTLLITQAENQLNAAKFLHRNNILRHIGDRVDIVAKTIRMETEQLLGDVSRRTRESVTISEMVNKNGTETIVQTLLEAM